MSSSKRPSPSSSTRRSPPDGDSRAGRQMERPDAFSAGTGKSGPSQPFELDPVGDLLRRARGRRGESLDAISGYLRIRPGFLAALENSRYDELPADAYVTGFLRTYADYLGLNGKDMVDQYRREMAGRRRRPQLNMPQPVSEGRAPTAVVMLAAFVACLLLYGLWYGLSSSGREAVKEPSLPQSTAAAETPSSAGETSKPAAAQIQPAQPASPGFSVGTAMLKAGKGDSLDGIFVNAASPLQDLTPLAAPADVSQAMTMLPKGKVYGEDSSSSRLVLRVEKEAWILVADAQGNTVFDKILKPGDVYSVPAAKGLKLTTGNGNGVVLSLDGKDLPRLAPDSRLVRNVPLDPEALADGDTKTGE